MAARTSSTPREQRSRAGRGAGGAQLGVSVAPGGRTGRWGRRHSPRTSSATCSDISTGRTVAVRRAARARGLRAMATRFVIRLAGVAALLLLHSMGPTAGQPSSGGGSSDTTYGREFSWVFGCCQPQLPNSLTPALACPQRCALLLAPSRVVRDAASLEAALACWRSARSRTCAKARHLQQHAHPSERQRQRHLRLRLRPRWCDPPPSKAPRRAVCDIHTCGLCADRWTSATCTLTATTSR